MRLLFPCQMCFAELGTADKAMFQLVQVQDAAVYRFRCQRGHALVVWVQEQKFEVLFEVAASAICDGYFREAVSSFTSALERFYEFLIHVICIERKIDEEQVKGTRRHVASRSEREAGAFAFVYLLHFGRSPNMLSDKQVSFRNKVIHKGHIPSRKEAMAYGQRVLTLIAPMLRELKQTCPDSVNQTVKRFAEAATATLKAGERIQSSMSSVTIISISSAPEYTELDLANAIVELMKRREKTKDYPLVEVDESTVLEDD